MVSCLTTILFPCHPQGRFRECGPAIPTNQDGLSGARPSGPVLRGEVCGRTPRGQAGLTDSSPARLFPLQERGGNQQREKERKECLLLQRRRRTFRKAKRRERQTTSGKWPPGEGSYPRTHHEDGDKSEFYVIV